MEIDKKPSQGLKNDYLRKKLRISLNILFNEFEKVQILRKYFVLMEIFCFDGNKFFGSKKLNGENNTENSFALQNEPHRAQLSFSDVLKHFCQKLTKKPSLLGLKIDYL